MSVNKRRHAVGICGRQKIRPGRAHNGHAPDAVRPEYRGENPGRKENFTRKFSAKSDWPIRPIACRLGDLSPHD